MKNSGTRRSTTTKGRQTKRKTTRTRSKSNQRGLYREIFGILLILSGLLALLAYTSWIGIVGDFFAYIPRQLFGVLYGIPTLLVMYWGLRLLLHDPMRQKRKAQGISKDTIVKWLWYVLLFITILSLISFIMQDVTTPVPMLDEAYRITHGGLIGSGIADFLYTVGNRLGGLIINIFAFIIFLSLACKISLGKGIRVVGEKSKGPAKQIGHVVKNKSVQAAQATSDYISTVSLPKTKVTLFDRTKDMSAPETVNQNDVVGEWWANNRQDREEISTDAPLTEKTVDEPVVSDRVESISTEEVETLSTTRESSSPVVPTNAPVAPSGRTGLNFTSYVSQQVPEEPSASQSEDSYNALHDDFSYSEGQSFGNSYKTYSPDAVNGHGYAAGYGSAQTEEYVQDNRTLTDGGLTSNVTTQAVESDGIKGEDVEIPNPVAGEEDVENQSLSLIERSWSQAMAEDYGNLRDGEEGVNSDSTSTDTIHSATEEEEAVTPSTTTTGLTMAFGSAVQTERGADPLVSEAKEEVEPFGAPVSAAIGSVNAPLSPVGAVNPLMNAVSTEEDTKAVAVNTDGGTVPSGRLGLGLRYELPSLMLLSKGPDSIVNQSEVTEKSGLLEQTLSSFKINSKVVSATRGPAVTRYEMDLPPGVKVSRILNLADNIKLALAAADIRMEAPIPGKSLVGIEVPNSKVSPVHLRDVLDCPEFKNAKGGVPVGLGKDISGKPIITDLTKMPHLLVAGSTGSGKSVCINTLISSILFSRKPDEVKLILIDPKMVELSTYDKIPHLMVPVVTDMKKAASVLRWAVREMEARYTSFAAEGCKNIEGYNKQCPNQAFPYIVLVIDELADLMMTAPDDVEDSICRLAQKARAAGIHMVLATQRPSVNVITGTIKANVPSRISFAVATQIDSRTILDMAGAEKLLGKGDMLFYPTGANKPVRIQGAFISDDEVEALVNFVKGQAAQQFNESAQEALKDEPEPTEEETKTVRQDEFLEKAVNVAFDYGASTSMLQRRIHVGYSRAGSLIDAMEELKILGPANGSKPRELLMTKEEALALVNRQGN